ncbi:hypothetical protein ACIBUY_15375 [Streptomyces sp. NPDC050085]|uniref:hypothetical protein n=1 Tax=Streptomyces sp. NPDC050085 TaxID=3365600 RepID=UPI0037AF1D0C
MPPAPPSPEFSNGTERGRSPSRLRLFGLLAVVVLTAALPLAGASAGPVDDGPARPSAEKAETAEKLQGTQKTQRAGSAGAADKVDDKAAGAGASTGASSGRPSSTLLADLGLATAAHCGPQLASPEGIEAQTCVLRQGRDTWARTYYRNTTGEELSAVLTLMAPGGRTVQINCVVGAEDEPELCETPRGASRGELAQYAAVAEFAAGDAGPLLLRSGSNSAPTYGR